MNHNLKNILIAITLAALGVVVMAIFGYIMFYVVDSGEARREVEVIGQLEVYQGLSKTYYARLGFYDGLCEEGIAERYTCRDSDEEFKVYTHFQDSYYCTDATGDVGEVQRVPRGMTCQ